MLLRTARGVWTAGQRARCAGLAMCANATGMKSPPQIVWEPTVEHIDLGADRVRKLASYYLNEGP